MRSMKDVLGDLKGLRSTTRRLLLVRAIALVVGVFLAGLVIIAALDYLVHFPKLMRVLIVIPALAALAWFGWRSIRAAASYMPSLTAFALRLEERHPVLRGRLASAIEFVSSGVANDNQLARAATDHATELANRDLDVAASVERRPVRRALLVTGGIVAACMLIVVLKPANAGIGVARVLMPWSDARWPARTAVASLMNEVLEADGVHPQGKVLTLRARNLTPGGNDEEVVAYYRLQRDDGWTRRQRAVLTHQGGGVHERLIETDGDAIDVWFETKDNQTSDERITLVPPPAVLAASVAIEPPTYAQSLVAPLAAELGPGIDDRARTADASLNGSWVTLEIELNKPLPVPADDERGAWIDETFGWERAQRPGIKVSDDQTKWTLDWELTERTVLAIDLRDEYGLGPAEPVRYIIDARPDDPPRATVTEPAQDDAALATAVLQLGAEGVDDVALTRLGWKVGLESTNSTEIPAEIGDGFEIFPESKTRASLESPLDLSAFDLEPGDTVVLRAVAEDGYERAGETHAPVLSPARRIRIIDEQRLAEIVRTQLSSVRQNAIRMEAQQGALQDAAAPEENAEGSDAPTGQETREARDAIARQQADLGDRIAEERASIESMRERLQQNRMDDAALEQLLRQSQDLLDYAGRGVNRAIESLESQSDSGEAGESGEPESATPTEAEARELAEAQQDVRDELSDLIELLDRDEDTWLVKRQISRLIEEQAKLQEDTAEVGDELIGRETDELTPQEQSTLDSLSEPQEELAAQFDRLVEEMRRRAESMEELDEASADAMREAADIGESREVSRDMREAAEAVEENRMRNAAEQQQQAMDALERMQEQIETSKRAQAEELARELSDLVDSIERLVEVQEREIIGLNRLIGEAEATSTAQDRARAMVRLTQNTRAVAAQARESASDARRIARLLDRAAEAQGEAITLLRVQPLDGPRTVEEEERSLERLREAQELATTLQEQAEEDQLEEARDELIAAYRAQLAREVAVRDESRQLGEKERLTRRDRVTARELGNRQESIRNELEQLARDNEDLAASTVFSYVHRLIDRWSIEVRDSLWDGTVDAAVTDRAGMIAEAIAQQLAALEAAESPDDQPFADATQPPEGSEGGGGGGGGGGGPQPLLPPVIELVRMRGLQEEIYRATRVLNESPVLAPEAVESRLEELGVMQQDLVQLGGEILLKLQGGGGSGPPPEPEAGSGDQPGEPSEPAAPVPDPTEEESS